MAWLGGLIVLGAFAAMVKGYEIRLVLFLAGLSMAILAVNPGAALDAFGAAMVSGDFVPVICTTAGFAYVMKKSGCEWHFLRLLAGCIKGMRPFLIPGTVLITFAVNIMVPMAAGCAAVVGVLLIPVLLRAGVHPAAAAAAVLAGTWGSVLNSGQIHNPFIARLAGITEAAVIAGHSAAVLAGLFLAAAALAAVARWKQEDHGYEQEEEQASDGEEFKVDYLKAFAPCIPLLLLLAGSPVFGLLPWDVTVPAAMLVGVVLGFGATLQNPENIARQFFAGIGEAYGGIIGVTIAVAVFTKGAELSGVTGALINAIKHSEHFAGQAAAFGPFLLAVLTGSGDGATLAFNAIITPYAGQFGYDVAKIGSLAFISGGLGRAMSPLSAAAIVCAALAKAGPAQVAWRNAPGAFLAAGAAMVILL